MDLPDVCMRNLQRTVAVVTSSSLRLAAGRLFLFQEASLTAFLCLLIILFFFPQALTFFTLDDVPKLRPIVQVMRKSPNSKIPNFLSAKLTRNLRVKGEKKHRPSQQSQGKRFRRKPFRPISKQVTTTCFSLATGFCCVTLLMVM